MEGSGALPWHTRPMVKVSVVVSLLIRVPTSCCTASMLVASSLMSKCSTLMRNTCSGGTLIK